MQTCGGTPVTRGTKIVLGVLTLLLLTLACFVVHFAFPGVVWHWLFEVQSGAIGLGLITGIASSLAAAIIYGFRHKEVWQDDVRKLNKDLDEIKTDLSTQLKELRHDHDVLLEGIVPAIGGSFAKSLFEFHPMASKEIARILSNQTNDLYGRHHKRVIVMSANDRYKIEELKHLNSTVVWSLEFRTTWEWHNDLR